MKLKQYIDELAKLPQDAILKIGLVNPHSWRGFYAELSFEPKEDILVSDALKYAKECVGRIFCGYKGGEYEMDLDTKIHIDEHGCWTDGKLAYATANKLFRYGDLPRLLEECEVEETERAIGFILNNYYLPKV